MEHSGSRGRLGKCTLETKSLSSTYSRKLVVVSSLIHSNAAVLVTAIANPEGCNLDDYLFKAIIRTDIVVCSCYSSSQEAEAGKLWQV